MTSTTATHTRHIRRPRAIGLLAAAVLIVVATYGAAALRAPARPAAALADPATPAPIPLPGNAQALPAIGSIAQIDHSINAWTTNLAANPKDFISATNLATLYHARGRLTGDLDDQTRALQAARVAESIAPKETAAASLEASILYTIHDFSGSMAIADRLYRANPADLGSLATRADAELELGRLTAARADYTIVARGASGPAIDVRLARLAYLTGDAARALALARSAREGATDLDTDLGFYDYAVGEYARLSGDGTAARAAYAAAVELRPTDFGSLVGLAKVDAAAGDVATAIAELEQASAIVPQPETLTLLGDLRALGGDAKGAADAYATVRAIRRLSTLQGTVYDRQLLQFELDHGGATPAILAAADSGLASRTDAAGYDLASWAAYRLGQFDLAERDIDAALGAGIRDARILEHAGAIAIARGDRAHGRELLAEALALGPALDPLATREAASLIAGS